MESEQRAAVQHGWQQRGPLHPHEQIQKRRVGTRRKVWLFLAGCSLLLAALLYLVLTKPQQTPVIYIAPTGYTWPLPPTAMAAEDKRALRDLDDENGYGTLEFTDLSEAWESREAGLEALRETLQELSSSWSPRRPLIIYMCLHGASDENQTPYLLTPDASATNVNTWLEFQQVLRVIGDVAQRHPALNDRPKLLVLDCGRMPRNWSLGLLKNRFNAGVEELVRTSEIPNLAVLSSTSREQQALIWRERRASAFGHFFRAGLAGEAADASGYVTAQRLADHLSEKVNNWARRNRGTWQQPALWFTPNSRDFLVAHGVSVRLKNPNVTAESPRMDDEIARFWEAHEDMRQARVDGADLPPTQTALLAWHDFEHRLLWLQLLAEAGEGYEVQAEELRQELESVVERFRGKPASAAAFTFWSEFDSFSPVLTAPTTHSLPLGKYFGAAEHEQAGLALVRGALDAASEQPTREEMREARQALRRARTQHNVPPLIEGYLPELLDNYWMPVLDERAGHMQRLLRLRQRVEEQAAPSDHRLIRWLQPLLRRVDAERRRAEDLLFVGEADGEEQLAAAEAALNDTERRKQLLADAYQLRDRCRAELPYLAWWFTRPEPTVPRAGISAEDTPGDETFALPLESAIDLTHALDTLLTRDEQDDALLAEIQSAVLDLSDARQAVGDLFAADCRRLRSQENLDAAAVRDIERLLAVPLLSPAERADLVELRAGFQPPESTELPEDPEEDAGVRWESRTRHPALMLVAPASDALELPEGGNADLAAQERALRKRLRELPETLRSYTTSDGQGVERAGWRNAESLLRRYAPLLAIDRTLRQVNPLGKLRRHHLQQLLLWHGRRALADLSALGEELGAAYLDSAEALGPLPTQIVDDYQRLSREVARFGQRGLQVDTEQLLLPVSEANLQADVRQRQPLPDAAPGDGGPAGHATLFVRDSRGRVVNRRPRGVTIPLASETTRHELMLEIQPEENPSLYTVLMFRGREFSEDFLPERIGGFRVDFEPQEYERTQVTLGGYRNRRASIVFVLDCSYSMRQTIPGEQQDDGRSRMDIAKSKLQEMLQRLGREDDVRVGVYFFGHRRGWSRENPNEAVTQDAYVGAENEELEALHPGEDVEEVLPLGRFGPLIAERVIDKLEKVVGWGQTPLYLSLVRAQEAFAADDEETEKSIVVITDGRNYQFAPPNNPLGPLNTTGTDDVLEAWRQYGAKVHIVSLALQAENVAEVEQEFDELARRTGGRYVAARNASSLINELRDLLGPARYSIEDLTGREVGMRSDGTIGPALLDETLTITPPPDAPSLYRLQHDQLTKQLEVHPGDALRLRVSDDGRFIEAVPYDDNGLAAEADLVAGRGGPATPLVVRAHAPRANLEENSVRFRVSLQRKDLEVTSRPAESWVEVTPLAADGATELEPTYFFYDRDFQAGEPVPVLSWEARDWPFQQARYAKLRFWSKPARTLVPEAGRIPLRRILTDPDTYATPRDISSLVAGVRLRVEGRQTPDAYRLDVVELHEGPQPDMAALKVVVSEDPNAPLQRVTRQFDREHGIAIHSFYFPTTAEGVFRRSDDAQLLLVPASLVKQDAWQIPLGEELEVEVSQANDILQPGPVLSLPRN